MTSAATPSRTGDHLLAWALLLSLALHALGVMVLRPFDFSKPPKLEPELQIKLEKPKPEPPPPPPPEPPKPKETPKPQPVQPKKPLPEPPPVKLPEPAPVQPRVETPPPPPPPTVIAIAPKVEEPPAFVAPPPPPEPPKPAGPTPQEIEAARHGYGNQLAREFAKHKQYPRMAQMRGWQGTVRVQLELDAAGNVVSTAIAESSGHDILDQQALEMVKKATPLPLPPDILRNKSLTILVPVPFRLE